MRTASVYVQGALAGFLKKTAKGHFVFFYTPGYKGPSVSLTMPITKTEYTFEEFPPFFEGLLPEGSQLESLLRREKIDRDDYFSQLLIVGGDLVGDVTLKELEEIGE